MIKILWEVIFILIIVITGTNKLKYYDYYILQDIYNRTYVCIYYTYCEILNDDYPSTSNVETKKNYTPCTVYK